MSDQWLRKVQLIITPGLGEGNQGRDLSEMHIQFQISQSDEQTPGTAYIRIFNLAPPTVKGIMDEYNGVILSAGYQDSEQFGMIFQGTLKQITRGRVNPVDHFLDIYAADYDVALNFPRINKFLPAPVLPKHQLAEINKAIASHGVAPSNDPPPNGTVLKKGKVMYGMMKVYGRDYAITQESDWSVQNGKLQFTPRRGYRGSGTIDIVEINEKTGMIGIPEQTQDGINVRTLLNPRFRVGDLVRLNSSDITQTEVRGANFPLIGSQAALFSPVNDPDRGGDGLYRILVCEHRGDTRGLQWYSDLVCLAAPGGQVALYGGTPY